MPEESRCTISKHLSETNPPEAPESDSSVDLLRYGPGSTFHLGGGALKCFTMKELLCRPSLNPVSDDAQHFDAVDKFPVHRLINHQSARTQRTAG